MQARRSKANNCRYCAVLQVTHHTVGLNSGTLETISRRIEHRFQTSVRRYFVVFSGQNTGVNSWPERLVSRQRESG